jgi:hypothetical protein
MVKLRIQLIGSKHTARVNSFWIDRIELVPTSLSEALSIVCISLRDFGMCVALAACLFGSAGSFGTSLRESPT